jgi:hypothetical protein
LSSSRSRQNTYFSSNVWSLASEWVL